MTDPTSRTLTDADVAAIAEALKEKVVTEFYQDLGKGIWSYLWKAIIATIIAIAAYGHFKGLK